MDNTKLAFVDACVLLDIFNDDEHWAQWSSAALFQASKDYTLAINNIISTEIAFNFDSSSALLNTLEQLNIIVLDIPIDAAFNTSRAFIQYKKRGGDKKTPMPDFYIGAHAYHMKAYLITRDTARFKSYFPKLRLITP